MDAQLDIQQSDRTKQLFKRYGIAATVLIVALLLVLGGWQYHKYRRNAYLTAASAQYESLLNMVNQPTQALEQAKLIRKQYGQTTYAYLASLLMAKIYVDQNQLPQAEAALRWALLQNSHSDFTAVAKIRLARVLIAEKKYQSAIEVLEESRPSARQHYVGMYDYIIAEAYAAQGKTEQAASYYQKANQALADDPSLQAVVQMKLSNLSAQKTN